jgi:YD repeat-containing protein
VTCNGQALYSLSVPLADGRDNAGRILKKVESMEGGTPVEWTYSYDLAGRLEIVKKDGATVRHYVYDANGNRISEAGPNATPIAHYDNQDRIIRYEPLGYFYTARGTLYGRGVSAPETTFGYDVFGNLKSFQPLVGPTITYRVDGLNRRVARNIGSARDKGYLWLSRLRPSAQLDANGNVSARYVCGRGVNVPEYMVTSSGTYRLIRDHIGSVRLVVNVETCQVVQRLEYDEFGNGGSLVNPDFQPFGFAGGLTDYSTGLVPEGSPHFLAARS